MSPLTHEKLMILCQHSLLLYFFLKSFQLAAAGVVAIVVTGRASAVANAIVAIAFFIAVLLRFTRHACAPTFIPAMRWEGKCGIVSQAPRGNRAALRQGPPHAFARADPLVRRFGTPAPMQGPLPQIGGKV